jgi:hypothetical protein
MQEWIVTALRWHDVPMTTTALHAELMNERSYERKRRGVKDRERSARNSLARALRGLTAAGTIRCEHGQWSLTAPHPADVEREKEEKRRRTAIAYHEAGHAVIGRSRQLPVGFATIKQRGRFGGYVTGIHDRPDAVGLITKRVRKQGHYKSRGKIVTYPYMDYEHVADLGNVDAFGNSLPKRRPISTAEHEAEILMCIAGGMAEAKHKGVDPTTWREFASPADMSIARDHMRPLGTKARSWEDYARETLALIREHWQMIEKVAADLLEHETLSGFDIDDICCKVVRQQHLKKAKRKDAA